MNNQNYRVRIVAREKPNSDTLYIVDSEVFKVKNAATLQNISKGVNAPKGMNGNSYVAASDISISELVDNINIYDYDTGKNKSYSDNVVGFSKNLYPRFLNRPLPPSHLFIGFTKVNLPE